MYLLSFNSYNITIFKKRFLFSNSMPKTMEIPFYVGEGRRCAQAALMSLFDFKGVKKTYQELDSIVCSDSQNSVSMLQMALALHNQGLKFYYPVKPVFETMTFQGLVDMINGNYCERIARFFNPENLMASLDEIRLRSLFTVQNQRPSLEELSNFLERGKIILPIISYDRLVGKEKSRLRQNGHYMVLTGIENDFVYAHDSGPKGAMPNRPIRKDKFLESWDFSLIDWDILVVD